MEREQNVALQNKAPIDLALLTRPGVFHFFGTKGLTDTTSLFPNLKRPKASITVRQVHGDQICRITDDALHRLSEGHSPDASMTGDALTTNRPDVLMMVSTADCVPVLLFDPVAGVVAAVHAGWRGTLLNICPKVVREMVSHYGVRPKNLIAGIGPSIGPCCYQVGEDVFGEVIRSYPYGREVVVEQGDGKAMLHLGWLNHLQLEEAGLLPENIAASGRCTFCNPDDFYSYRRDRGKLGGMLSGIMLVT